MTVNTMRIDMNSKHVVARVVADSFPCSFIWETPIELIYRNIQSSTKINKRRIARFCLFWARVVLYNLHNLCNYIVRINSAFWFVKNYAHQFRGNPLINSSSINFELYQVNRIQSYSEITVFYHYKKDAGNLLFFSS